MAARVVRYVVADAAGKCVAAGSVAFDDADASGALAAISGRVPAGGQVQALPDATEFPAAGSAVAFPKLAT